MAPGLFPGPGPSVNIRPVCMARPFAPWWVNKGIAGPMTGAQSGIWHERVLELNRTQRMRIAIVGYPADRRVPMNRKQVFHQLVYLATRLWL